MKRTLLTIFLLLAMVSAAFAEPVVDSALPAFTWERDATYHWRVLENGALTNWGEHQLAENRCTVCGSEVWVFDGSADVSDYNTHGDLVRYSLFGEDDTEIFKLCYAYEYDAEGRMLVRREFTGDVLTGEITYAVNDNGESYAVSQVMYNADDTWSVSTYDTHGNVILRSTYDTDGTLSLEELGEFVQDAQGHDYEFRHTSRYADGTVAYVEYNPEGDPVLRYSLQADGTVLEDITCEYAYQDGLRLWKKQYESGVLTLEVHYHEDGCIEEKTEYLEDGTRTITRNNEYADPVAVTVYRGDGSIERTSVYEYEYNDDLSWRSVRSYTDGALTILTEYADEDGLHFVCRETTYDHDGSYTVMTYNAAEELLTQTSYGANGQVIE